ncbi:MAG: hypothetical protein AAF492_06710, partial [Verrucomicrobiota bacterium]
MTSNTLGRLIMIGCLFLGSMAHGKKKIELTPEGEQWLKTYTQMLEGLKQDIAAVAPKVDANKKNTYIELHGEIARLPKRPNPKKLKLAPVTFCKGNPAYAAAQTNALIAAKELLQETEAFLAGDEIHAKLAKCALLTDGMERMAEFAQQGPEEKTYVDLLLGNDRLIVEVMEL